jgi:hypothetical protein
VNATDTDRFETNLAGHRTLRAELKHVDVRLQIWAPWAKPHYSQLGFPTRSVTERVNEGGIMAKDASPPHSPEWPWEVAECDSHVAKLPTRHMAAIMANYFHMALTWEQRAIIYVDLLKYLARTRPQPNRRDSLGSWSFRDDLDRARWTLKALLSL